MLSRANIKHLVLGVILTILSIKSTKVSWAVQKATIGAITTTGFGGGIQAKPFVKNGTQQLLQSDDRASTEVADTDEVGGSRIEEMTITNPSNETAVMRVAGTDNTYVADLLNASSTDPPIAQAIRPVKAAVSIKSSVNVSSGASAKITASSKRTVDGSNSVPSMAGTSGNGTVTTADLGVEDFVHHPGVVIAVKIHGDAFIPEIKQSFCLLHAAYNSRVLYDIIIFHTIQLPEKDKEDVRKLVHPVNVTFAMDEKTFEQQIAELSPTQQQILVDRCPDANKTEDLHWHIRCREGKHFMPLAYNWMSEFRSKHIWTQKALANYKYMLWYDSDSFATQVWHQDPVAYMIRHKLVLLMGNYPQGLAKVATGVHKRIFQVYNKTICNSRLNNNGSLRVAYGTPTSCKRSVAGAHGYFHITDLDFYRLPLNLRWSEVMIGDGKFQRTWDDQLAVIVPPSMLAPGRAVDMEKAGLALEVMHNSMFMGRRMFKGGAYKKFFRREAAQKFPEAMHCKPFIKVPSR